MALPTIVRNELARLAYLYDMPRGRGRPRKLSTLQTLSCIFYVCRTGCQWSELKCPKGVNFKTVYHRFSQWSRMRLFEDAFYNLSRTYTTNNIYPIIADTSYVKNVSGRDVIGRNHTDRGRMATKVSMLTDSRSVPLAFAFHKGNRNDCKTLGHLLDVASRKAFDDISQHGALFADKGYDSALCRNQCIAHGLQPYIPKKSCGESWNSTRCAVEVAFGRLDRFRRILMRHDFRIIHFKSFHYLAASCLVSRA